MKALVVYESMWGNTRQVAEAIGRGLGEATVLDVNRAIPSDVDGVGLLVLGGPTHAFSMTRASTRHQAHDQGASEGNEARGLRELLTDLPARLEVPIATFDTRAAKVKGLPGSAAKAAAKEVRRHHHGHVVERESFYVDGTDGPLVTGELERAESWGKALADVRS